MSTPTFVPRNFTRDWWEKIGLRDSRWHVESHYERQIEAAVLSLLREQPPVAFASPDGNGQISLDEFLDLVEAKRAEAVQATEQAAREAAEVRRVRDDALFESAYAQPDADEEIPEGRWAGFTRGDAFAWSWTLFQYEPHGFISPGSQLRHQSIEALGRGELPTVFGYPERAKELAARGLTPRQYRHHKNALGESTFDPAEVRHNR